MGFFDWLFRSKKEYEFPLSDEEIVSYEKYYKTCFKCNGKGKTKWILNGYTYNNESSGYWAEKIEGGDYTRDELKTVKWDRCSECKGRKVKWAEEYDTLKTIKEITSNNLLGMIALNEHNWWTARAESASKISDLKILEYLLQSEEDGAVIDAITERINELSNKRGNGDESETNELTLLKINLKEKILALLAKAVVIRDSDAPEPLGNIIDSGSGSQEDLWTFFNDELLNDDLEIIQEFISKFGARNEFGGEIDLANNPCITGPIKSKLFPDPENPSEKLLTEEKIWILRTDKNSYIWEIAKRTY